MSSTAPRGGFTPLTITGQALRGSFDSSIGVTFTRAEITPRATDSTSREYQLSFAAAPRPRRRKPLGGLLLDRIAGSTGTCDGFNDAIACIRRDAATVAQQHATQMPASGPRARCQKEFS